MNAPYDVIVELSSDNSRLFKEGVIAREMSAGNDELFEGITMAMDSMVTFGVKKVTASKGGGKGLSWADFKLLADALANRKLTGHAALAAIDVACNAATEQQWDDWYRRIFIKDLRCGMTETTVNNVAKKLKLKKYTVPVFTCQLAHGSEAHENKMVGEKLIEVKLDGVRVLSIVDPNGTVTQYSRNGKELVNFEHIKQQFASIVDKLSEPTVFDGEVMSSSFQDLMKQVHRKSNVNAGDAVLHLFDMVPLKDFQKGIFKVPQKKRSQDLQQWHKEHAQHLQNVQVLEQELVNLDTAQGQKRYAEINRAAIAGGYEGIMVKDVDAPYECKRVTHWLKLKPVIEVSLEVIAIEEGTGKNVGKLGALVCEGVDDGKKITVNVGSGYSDEQRDEYFTTDLIGSIAEVRADAITKNQDGSYSLRFPRFLRFRGFEAGEKI